jgi:hypothetical protein
MNGRRMGEREIQQKAEGRHDHADDDHRRDQQQQEQRGGNGAETSCVHFQPKEIEKSK